jgi:phosphatidate cytidylyltransferase
VLKHRLLFGPILLAAVLALLMGDIAIERATRTETSEGIKGVIFFPLLAVLAVLGAQEIAHIFRALDTRASRRVLGSAAFLGLTATAFTPTDIQGFSGVAIVCSAAILVMLGAMLFYSRHKTTDGVVAATSTTILCFVYLGLFLGFFFILRREFSMWHVIALVVVTKAYDIGAFTAGMLIGKHKLIPWLSPGKTWEGLAGGVALAAAVSAGFAAVAKATGFFDDGSGRILIVEAAALGVVVGLVAQVGDLVASLFKRDAGVKDYASSVPGFGGVMDIIDSPLLVAPAAYWLFVALFPS